MIQVCKNSIAKQFYMNFCILELQVPRAAHRNGSCNESKTDMLAGAATSYNIPLIHRQSTLLIVVRAGSFRDIRLYPAIQLLCGIISHLFLSVVDRCCLTDDGKISSGADRQGVADDFIA